MKKVFIMIFLSISTFFIASAFITKGFNKEPMTFNVVLVEFEKSDIGFDIKNDIEELTTSLSNLNNSTSNDTSSTLSALKSIADTIYYFARFAIKMIVHTLVATLNVIILVLRCIGFTTMNYIHINEDNDNISIVPGVPFTDNPDIM